MHNNTGLFKDNMPNADELFPIMSYMVMCANPQFLYSNINYINEYLSPDRKLNKEGFVLTNLMASIGFLEKVDGKALLQGKVELKQIRPIVRKHSKHKPSMQLQRADMIGDATQDFEEEDIKVDCSFVDRLRKLNADNKEAKESIDNDMSLEEPVRDCPPELDNLQLVKNTSTARSVG